MSAPVLLVDDDADDLMALEAALSPLKLEIVRADSGADALRLLLKREFAIVVMDLMMPCMNGLEVCALIRARARCREMPVVILTGFDEDAAKRMPDYRPGFCEFMVKPVPPEALRAKVAESAARFKERTPVP